ncbi:hypothetical protein ACFSSC_03585 [Corynebacterium mendelii]|uniref:ATP-dependent RNA helicase Ski2/MTR4 C-terminal domain-containing protein n=1 Tax=Corynebacterium mendelii TaxID=2765362 RepID=A0A939DZ60_9CORY|nr:hypothetical protein [Corynebacterium mendelii]MBN9643514.1 hypothetical protein [Corynebacterium mendelii]
MEPGSFSRTDEHTATAASTVESFFTGLDRQAEPHQLQACELVAGGANVLLSALPGAGARLIGAFAAWHNRDTGGRCAWIVDAPLTATHRRRELENLLDGTKVGLIMDGREINADAPVVVTTVEIMRTRMHTLPGRFAALNKVILDGVHHIGDRVSGPAWEEVMMAVGGSVPYVAICDRGPDAADLAVWLGNLGQKVELVTVDTRPVPLKHWVIAADALLPLHESQHADGHAGTTAASPAGQTGGDNHGDGGDGTPVTFTGAGKTATAAGRSDRGQPGGEPTREELFDQLLALARASVPPETTSLWGPRRPKGQKVPPVNWGRRPLVAGSSTGYHRQLEILADNAMLPAVVVVPGRLRCDQVAESCLAHEVRLTDKQESAAIRRIVEAAVAGIPIEDLDELRFSVLRSQLVAGYAAHHTGVLPLFRRMIEDLFVRGLVKVVFTAGEEEALFTPQTKTVVLSSRRHHTPEAEEQITASTWARLAARAGRKGLDDYGHAVVVADDTVTAAQLAAMATGIPPRLKSALVPYHGMAARLTDAYGYHRARTLVACSFAERRDRTFTGEITARIREAETMVDKLHTAIADNAGQAPGTTGRDEMVQLVVDYALLCNQRMSHLDYLAGQAHRNLRRTIAKRLTEFNHGDVIALPGRRSTRLAAVVNDSAPQGNDPVVHIFHPSGRGEWLTADSVAYPPVKVGVMRLERPPKNAARPRSRKISASPVSRRKRAESFSRVPDYRAQVSAGFAAGKYPVPDFPERSIGDDYLSALDDRIAAHPVHGWEERELMRLLADRLIEARRSLAQLRDQRIELGVGTTRIFDITCSQLTSLGYMDDATAQHTAADPADGDDDGDGDVDGKTAVADKKLTATGTLLAGLTGRFSLLAAECISRGVWSGLSPAELAGVASMCTGPAGNTTGVEAPTRAMQFAMTVTRMTWWQLEQSARARGLAPAQAPNEQACVAMYLWTTGKTLAECRETARLAGQSLSPGMFVDWAQATTRLLETIVTLSGDRHLAAVASQAISHIRRGVVTWGY